APGGPSLPEPPGRLVLGEAGPAPAFVGWVFAQIGWHSRLLLLLPPAGAASPDLSSGVIAGRLSGLSGRAGNGSCRPGPVRSVPRTERTAWVQGRPVSRAGRS